MSTTREPKNKIATEESVARVCDALFRAGERIVEATVRERLGGGSSTTIMPLIHLWHTRFRERVLRLETQVEQIEAGQRPPDVPEALWAALKPVWDDLLAQSRAHAEDRLAGDRDALVTEQQALDDETERVRELDARWQHEKQAWSERIDGLNQEIQRQKTKLTELAHDLIEAGREATAQTVELEGLRQQLIASEGRVHAAAAAHQADLQRWAQQVDDVRQDAKAKAAAASVRIRTLEEQLQGAQSTLADLRIEHERTRGVASAAQAADARSQADLQQVRQELALLAEQRREEATANTRIIDSLQASLDAARAELTRLAASPAKPATSSAGRQRGAKAKKP